MWKKGKENRFVLLLLLTGAVYFFLKYIVPLVGPILIAMLFVMMFGPLLKKMQQKLRLNRPVGAVLLLTAAGIFLAGFLWTLFVWIMGSLPEWMKGLQSFEDEINMQIHRFCEGFSDFVGVDGAYLEEIFLSELQEGMTMLGGKTFPGMLSQSLEYVRIFGALGGFLAVFLIAAVLLAKDYDLIMNRLLDNEDCHVLLEVVCSVVRYLATYVKAQVAIMAAIGLLASLTLGLCGISHGVFWGILAGILDALPFIGTGIVLMPLTLGQIFQGHYGRAAVCVLLYVACVLLRQFLEPRLIGRQIGVPPVAVLLSLYAGIKLFGVWGIVKGPLGFILIYQTWLSVRKREDNFWEMY